MALSSHPSQSMVWPLVTTADLSKYLPPPRDGLVWNPYRLFYTRRPIPFPRPRPLSPTAQHPTVRRTAPVVTLPARGREHTTKPIDIAASAGAVLSTPPSYQRNAADTVLYARQRTAKHLQLTKPVVRAARLYSQTRPTWCVTRYWQERAGMNHT